MKQCLADVNVWLALLVRHHVKHNSARRWFDGLAAGEAAFCRVTQLAVVRLLGTRPVMGEFAMPASNGWSLVSQLLEDERVEFAAEPGALGTVLPTLLRYRVPTSNLVGDAYLAAFSMAATMRIATFDKGFREFREADVQLLQ